MISLPEQKIVVTGGAGFLGSAVCRALSRLGCENVFAPRSREFDLTVESHVERLYETARPDVVIHLAAEVGGIGANMAHPGRYFYSNLAMGLHLIEHARRNGVKRFVHTGTVCSYPKDSKQCRPPFHERNIWNGFPEETNAPYGIAKKSLMVMLDGYRKEYGLDSCVVIPTNLYGPGDNFDPDTSHVIPAIVRKCHEAVESKAGSITCWGTGIATRQFLYVDDAADGVVRIAGQGAARPANLGGGEEITIWSLTKKIASLCGFAGEVKWDTTKPDGQPRRAVSTINAREMLGWSPKVSLDDGLAKTVQWWRSQNAR